MIGDLNPIEEQALDVLLSEAHGGGNPPDLSRKILARWREEPSAISIRPASVSVSKSGASTHRFVLAAAVVASLAASLLIGIWLRGNRPRGNEGVPLAGLAVDHNESADVPPDPTAESKIEPSVEAIAENGGSKNPGPTKSAPDSSAPMRSRPRGIPLLVDSGPTMSGNGLGDSVKAITPGGDGESEPVTLVAQQVDTDLRDYWRAIGIKPAESVSNQTCASRWFNTLGIELSPDSVGDVELLRAEIANPQTGTEIARRWLSQITDGGLARIDEQQRDALIEKIASCLRGEQRLDQTLAAWIGGQSKNESAEDSSAFYAAISTGRDGKSGHETMVRQLASLSMNVDLRCTRCHDSLIEGNGRQEDYWSFASFLQRGVNQSDGRWSVKYDNHSAEPFFYELPDGRQRIVEPGIASTWLPGSERVTNLHEFSQRLVGSQSLAGGVVNSLWQLVHGRPLRGRVIDTISAPHNDSLDQLERRLTGDLVRSGFDVRRTLALIMTSPTTNRAVPATLLPENALVANDADVRRAMDSVDAFAAALPPRGQLSMSGRLDLAMRSIGAKLDDLSSGERVFAQRIGDDGSASKPARDRDTAPTGFPERSLTSLPVQWLERVESLESRVDHLGYLAGLNQVPEPVREAAAAMRAAEVSDELLLHRVWWLVSP